MKYVYNIITYYSLTVLRRTISYFISVKWWFSGLAQPSSVRRQHHGVQVHLQSFADRQLQVWYQSLYRRYFLRSSHYLSIWRRPDEVRHEAIYLRYTVCWPIIKPTICIVSFGKFMFGLHGWLDLCWPSKFVTIEMYTTLSQTAVIEFGISNIVWV